MIREDAHQRDTTMEAIPESRSGGEEQGSIATGPKAVFLSGFDTTESTAVGDILARSGFPNHRIVLCTEAMLSMRLEDALRDSSSNTPVPGNALPRIIIVSGIHDGRIRHLLDAYRATGLASPIWATTTESNLQMSVRNVIRHLLDEYRRMSANGTTK